MGICEAIYPGVGAYGVRCQEAKGHEANRTPHRFEVAWTSACTSYLVASSWFTVYCARPVDTHGLHVGGGKHSCSVSTHIRGDSERKMMMNFEWED